MSGGKKKKTEMVDPLMVNEKCQGSPILHSIAKRRASVSWGKRIQRGKRGQCMRAISRGKQQVKMKRGGFPSGGKTGPPSIDRIGKRRALATYRRNFSLLEKEKNAQPALQKGKKAHLWGIGEERSKLLLEQR